MRQASLRSRLFLLIVLITIPVFALHEVIAIRGAIRAATDYTAAHAQSIGTATVPILKSALIVGDLALARETLDNLMHQGQFNALRLLDADGHRPVLAGTPPPGLHRSGVPAWFSAWLDLRFEARRFPVEAGGTPYGVLVIEPSAHRLEAEIWTQVWTEIALWLASLALALVLLRLTLRRDLKPIEDLAETARRLGEGDLACRATVSRIPELAETALAFNRMADKLAGERERLEQQVKQATRDLENLITRIPAGVYKLRINVDDSLRFEFVSPRWCALLELDAETVARDPWAPLAQLHPEEEAGFRSDFDRARQTRSAFQWEGRLRPELGTRWLRIEASPTPLEDGSVLWEGIQYDISEHKQVEEALRASELKLRGLYELSPLGIALTDMQGHYVEFNEAFRTICGYPADELRQLDYWTLTPRHYEASEQRQLESLRLTGRYGPYEKEYLRKDGRLVSLNLNGMLVQGPDGQDYIWSIVEDITEKKRQDADLRRLNQAITHASEAFLICSPDYRVEYINPSFEQLFGYTLAEMRGQSIAILVPEDPALSPAHAMVLDDFSGERLRRAKDGRLIPVLLKVSRITGDDGSEVGFVGTMTDLTAIKAMEAARRDTLRELDSLIARIPAGVYKLRSHPEGGMRFEYVSQRWCTLLEISETEVYRDPMAPFTRIHPDELPAFRARHEAALASLTPFQWEGRLREGLQVRWLHIESSPTLLDDGDVLWEGVQYDVTANKAREAELDHIAHYDPLTGVPNRMLLADRLHQAIAHAQRSEDSLAVCFLDLDGFKPVNDHLGHEAGDRLLVEIARRLLATVRGGDTVARLGGDEFVLLLAGMRQVVEYEATLNRILEVIGQPFEIDGQTISVSASIGIALYPKDDADPDLLLRHADQAMYQAKQAGRNTFIFFDRNFEDAARRHRDLLRQIEHGLAFREFELHYQPKVDMRRGTVLGFEALIRWRHPERGLLPPAEFLPMIEDHDLIIRLGEWVIDQALDQLREWRDQDLTVSVNLAARHVQEASFSEWLRNALARHPEVPPERLEIEIVETAALADTASAARLVNACRRLGVHFTLDDFGTGYASLTYLKRLPVRTLKIDQSFVRDMLVDANDLAIVEGVIDLADIFNRQVVAEGVETIEHGLLLLNMDCDLAQGYAIARPMPANEVPAWLRTWRPDPAWQSLGNMHWPRDDRALVIARHHHREWVEQVSDYLDGKRETPPELDGSRCRFGQWHDEGGRRRHGHRPEFAAITDLHTQVHRLGQALVDLADRDQRQAAKARLPELHALRDALLDQLQALLSSP